MPRFEVQNFQAISKASIDVEGFTVLVGPTHSGKSSFIRAVESAVYNQAFPGDLKKGKPYSRVKVDANGHHFEWEKSSSVQVMFDSELFRKLGRSSPDHVVDGLGLTEVEIEGSKLRPHFYNQLSPLFGLSLTATSLFTLMISIGECDRIPEVRKDVEKDIDRIKGELKVSTALIEDYESSIQGAEEKLGLFEKVDQKTLDVYIEKLRKFILIEDFLGKHSKLKGQYTAAAEKLGAVNLVLKELALASSELDKLVLIGRKLDLYKEKAPERARAANLLEKVNSLLDSVGKALPVYQKFLNSCDLMESWRACKSRADSYSHSLSTVITRLDEVDKKSNQINKFISLRGLLDAYAELLLIREEQDNKLSGIRIKLESLDLELNKIDTCPLCGAPIVGGKYEGAA